MCREEILLTALCERLDPTTPEGRLQTPVLRANTISLLLKLLQMGFLAFATFKS